MVSITPTFTPTVEGDYTLFVVDAEGCIYTTGDIDMLSVLIYNRWGELIYFCEQENISENLSICAWDGMVDGRKVPSGTYPVIVKFTNEQQNINKVKRDAIVVIE